MKTGVIILNYNDSRRAYDTYLNYKKMKNASHVIIVDNCSTDDSLIFLGKLNLGRDLIVSNKNGGYSYGNNFGIKFLEEKYNIDIVVISNPDVIIDEKNFDLILNGFKDNTHSLLTGIMKNPNGEISNMVYWRKTTFMDDFLSSFFLLRKLVKKYNLNGINYNKKIITVDTVPGSFFMVKSNVFKTVGYFDENVFLYHEEDIIARKLHNIGVNIGIVTASSFIHDHKASMMSYNQYKILLSSRLYFQRKYNNIGFFRIVIYKLCIFYSRFEYKLLLFLHSKKRVAIK